ncbi:MAG TPA: signal peptidase I [Acidimicrobiales bacterium]|nr:signal peptidase I [Acidimicrobiales bacterium]
MSDAARDDLLAVATAGPQREAASSAATKSTSRARSAIEWVLVIVGALAAALLIKTFLFQAFFIPSASMQPTLQIGDRVLVNKLSYKFGDIDRGDLVVFKRPDLPADSAAVVRDLIKRVIALPGETVEARDGAIYINGKKLNEPYLPSGTISENLPSQVVPAGRIWVMGDNRTNSRDSRVLGPIDIDTIHGRAFVRIWPLGEFKLF